MKIALVKQGFGDPDSEADVDVCVKAAAQRFETLGGTMHEVSVPLHRLGVVTCGPVGLTGIYHSILQGHGFGHNTYGVYPTSLGDMMTQIAGRGQEFPDTSVSAYYLPAISIADTAVTSIPKRRTSAANCVPRMTTPWPTTRCS